MFAYVHLSMAFVGGFLLLAATDAGPAQAGTTVIVCKGCVIVPDPEECRGCVVLPAPPAIAAICRGCLPGGAAALRPKPARPRLAPRLASAPPQADPPQADPPAPDAAAPGPVPGDRLVDVALVLGFPRADLDAGFARERRCLATAIYFEARGEPGHGQRAVAQVVLNRVSDRRYPATVCGVVFQNEERPNRCQFSFACDGRPEGIDDVSAWKRALLIAGEALSGRYFDESVGAATHYHAASVEPYWSRELLQIAQIGAHVFYRTGPPRQQEH